MVVVVTDGAVVTVVVAVVCCAQAAPSSVTATSSAAVTVRYMIALLQSCDVGLRMWSRVLSLLCRSDRPIHKLAYQTPSGQRHNVDPVHPCQSSTTMAATARRLMGMLPLSSLQHLLSKRAINRPGESWRLLSVKR